jgi:hypothetical protein
VEVGCHVPPVTDDADEFAHQATQYNGLFSVAANIPTYLATDGEGICRLQGTWFPLTWLHHPEIVV